MEHKVLGATGPKKVVKAGATEGKSARFYPADDVKVPKNSRKSKHNVSQHTFSPCIYVCS